MAWMLCEWDAKVWELVMTGGIGIKILVGRLHPGRQDVVVGRQG
jgi:hypothetical protein